MHKRIEANSPLTEAMARYETESGRKSRNGSTSCRTFDRLMGKHPVESITWDMLREFVCKLKEAGMVQGTVSRCIGDVKTVYHFITGKRLLPPMEPAPVDEVIDMKTVSVTRWAVRYCRDRGIVRREPIYSANRFARHMGDMRISAITTHLLIQFRKCCVAEGLKASTIESTICDLQTLVKEATGSEIKPGQRLKRARPRPRPVTFEAIDAVWPYCDARLRQWIVISYWTALRLSDAMDLMVSLPPDVPDVLEWTASKTQHSHRWPVVPWIHPYVTRRPLPFKGANSHSKKSLRAALATVCDATGVPHWTPKFLRQLSLSRWSLTDPMAGRIIHGCGLHGVLKHYVDTMLILESAAPKLPLPSCFSTEPPVQMADTELFSLFQHLDESQQLLVRQNVLALLGRDRRESFGGFDVEEPEPMVLKIQDWQ